MVAFAQPGTHCRYHRSLSAAATGLPTTRGERLTGLANRGIVVGSYSIEEGSCVPERPDGTRLVVAAGDGTAVDPDRRAGLRMSDVDDSARPPHPEIVGIRDTLNRIAELLDEDDDHPAPAPVQRDPDAVSAALISSSVLHALRASAHRCCMLFAQALIGPWRGTPPPAPPRCAPPPGRPWW